MNGRGVMIWTVLAPTRNVNPSDLRGNYAGVSAGAAIGVGLGANALVGGSRNTIALQPLSVQARRREPCPRRCRTDAALITFETGRGARVSFPERPTCAFPLPSRLSPLPPPSPSPPRPDRAEGAGRRAEVHRGPLCGHGARSVRDLSCDFLDASGKVAKYVGKSRRLGVDLGFGATACSAGPCSRPPPRRPPPTSPATMRACLRMRPSALAAAPTSCSVAPPAPSPSSHSPCRVPRSQRGCGCERSDADRRCLRSGRQEEDHQVIVAGSGKLRAGARLAFLRFRLRPGHRRGAETPKFRPGCWNAGGTQPWPTGSAPSAL